MEMDGRSLTPSHMPSCSTFLSEVILLVLPQRMKSASFNCAMKACLQDSALGDSSSLSVGGDARCSMSLSGVVWEVGGGPARIEEDMRLLSYMRPIGQCLGQGVG
jgi:hypothetical protein